MINNRLILNLFLLIVPFAVKAEYSNKNFIPNGYVGLTETFYGNAGGYKTATYHPSFIANYNFSPDWSLALQWDRTWNMYHYDGKENSKITVLAGQKEH